MKTDIINFEQRMDRSHYLAKRFSDQLKGKLLDVGCFEAPLREILKDVEYTGVDVAGNPDVELNLEKSEKLPFDDDSFDCVICIDVLEHLDNLHLMFHELFRVSSKYIIVSLPNCWSVARQPIGRGRGHFAHYGLPLERPLDRHKWFFSLTEAKDFLNNKANKTENLKILDMLGNEKKRNPITTFLRRIRYSNPENYANRYAHTVWALYEKGDKARP